MKIIFPHHRIHVIDINHKSCLLLLKFRQYMKIALGHYIETNIIFRVALVILISTIVPGCSNGSFKIKNVVKTDIDMIADSHLNEMNALMQELMIKLYKRNPRELEKRPGETIESRVAQTFNMNRPLIFEELDNKQVIDAMLLCFDLKFSGDRVFAVMAGLVGMIRYSYNNLPEFYMLDFLDEQKLNNSARNIEILVWRLSNKKDENENLFLLTNGVDGNISNLSFERIFGKMIAIQDMMASVVSGRTNRTINNVVKSVTSASFLPIGL